MGLVYTPVFSDGQNGAIQHRLVCSHCHAALAVPVPDTDDETVRRTRMSGQQQQQLKQPTVEALTRAHRAHPLATRWGQYHRAGGGGGGGGMTAWYEAYRCVHGFGGVDGGVVRLDSKEHPGKAKKAAWEVITVE